MSLRLSFPAKNVTNFHKMISLSSNLSGNLSIKSLANNLAQEIWDNEQLALVANIHIYHLFNIILIIKIMGAKALFNGCQVLSFHISTHILYIQYSLHIHTWEATSCKKYLCSEQISSLNMSNNFLLLSSSSEFNSVGISTLT